MEVLKIMRIKNLFNSYFCPKYYLFDEALTYSFPIYLIN